MKRKLLVLSISAGLILTSCGGSKSGDAAATTTETTTTTAPAGPAMTINEADWELKDLTPTSNVTPVSIKVPKTAKLEKNPNGGVDVKVNEYYMLTVYNSAVSSIKEGVDGDKEMSVKNSDLQVSKIELEEPNGFVYTTHYKGADGKEFPGESHFYYYFSAGGMFYSVHDDKDMSGTVPEGAFTPEIAKQVYNIVKASAKASK